MILDISKNNNLTPNQLREINRLAYGLRKDYNILISNYSKSFLIDENYWASEIPSRNSNDNEIFQNISFLLYAIKKTESKKVTKIIVEKLSMYKVLKNHFKDEKITLIYKENKSKLFLKMIYPFLKYFQNMLLVFKLVFFNSLTRILFNQDELKNNSILVDTFITNGSIKNNVFIDSYYNNFLNQLSSVENEQIFYVPSLVSINDYYKTLSILKKSNQKFLFKEDYLLMFDYLKAFLFPFKSLKFVPKNMFIRNIDFSPVFFELWYKNLTSLSSINGMLNFYFIRRLKKKKIKIKSFVNWFENQICDKCYNYAFNIFYPNVKKSGYLVFFDSKFYTSLYPLKYEKINNAIPEKIYTSSKMFSESIKEFCVDLDTNIICSFRNNFVWNKRKIYPKKNQYTILLTLSGVEIYRNEVLNLVNDANNFNSNVIFFVKLHPVDTIKFVKKSFNNSWPKNFVIVNEKFESLIYKCNLLISSNSTTILDSVSVGVPVIVVGSRYGLTQNPIPEKTPKSVYDIVYSKSEMYNSIIYFKDKFDSAKMSITFNEIRNQFYKKKSKEDLDRLLNLYS